MFWDVFSQVAILFVLIFVGMILERTGTLNKPAVDAMTDVAILISTPCVIVRSFMRPFDSQSLFKLSMSALLALAAHLLFILLAGLLLRDENIPRRRVLRFAAIFGNCGFMSLPLQQAILGDEGVFYGSVFVAVFNLTVWSYGLVLMSGDRKKIQPKKLIFNPGILAIVIGLCFFLCPLETPAILQKTVDYGAALNTPLPMMIIGYYLAKSDPFAVFKDVKALFAVLLRVLILPAAVLAALVLCRVRGVLLVSTVLASAAPVAALTTMFSVKYEGDIALSARLVSLSTLLSIITLPLLITAAQHFA